MALDKYTITITVSDPNDPSRKAEAVFHDCPRETVMDRTKVGPILSNLVDVFEVQVLGREA